MAAAGQAHGVQEINQILRWRTGWAPGVGPALITEKASAFVNVAPDTMVRVTRLAYELRTISDYAIVTFGYSSLPDGAGVFTPVLMQRRIYNPADLYAVHSLPVELYYDPPITIRYSSGARSVCFASFANDAIADLDIEWQGWWELDNSA